MPELELFEQLDHAIDLMLGGAPQPADADQSVAGLVEIAAALRDLPDDGFKTRLAAELLTEPKRRVPMTTTTAPAAIHTVTPYLSIREGNKFIDFLKHTFEAEVNNMHVHGPGDAFHAFVSIGGTALLIGGGEHARGESRPSALHVYVKDCDATYRRALEAGAIVPGPVGEPADRPYGERAAFIKDEFGNYWYIATRLGASYLPEGSAHVIPCLHPKDGPGLVDFLERALGAQEIGQRHVEGGVLMHTFLRIGEVTVELGGSTGPDPFVSTFYMYTDDVDSVYHRAVAAGAISIAAPADQPHGDRIAVFLDPAGNQWIPAKHL